MNTLQLGEGEMGVCCVVDVRCPEPSLFPPPPLPPPNHQRAAAVAIAAATAVAAAAVGIAFRAAFTAALTLPPLSPPLLMSQSLPQPPHRQRRIADTNSLNAAIA